MEELYNTLVEQGKYTKSFEDFKVQFGEPEKTKLLYDALNSSGDYTKSFEDFTYQFGFAEKKNQVVTPSTSEEGVTESTTEITQPTIPGSSDSSENIPDVQIENNVEIKEDLEVTDIPEQKYSNELFDELTSQVQIAQQINTEQNKKNFYKYKAESSFVRRKPKPKKKNPDALLEIDNDLKEKILNDFNIIKSIEYGIVSETDVDNALKGDINLINKLKEISVKNPKEYKKLLSEKRLDKTYAFEETSELNEYQVNQNEESKNLDLKKKIEAYDLETQRLLAENPNATEQEINELVYRPNDPNTYTDEEFEIYENMDYSPTGFEDSNIHKMYDSEKLKSIKGFNVKDFDGYLKEQGYMDRYVELLDDETISEDGRYQDYSGNYNPTLAAERLKAQYLTNYINNQVERNVEFQVLDYQLKNEGRHPSLDGVEISFNTGVDDIAMASYIEEQFPTLTAKLKNQDVENQENYQRYLDGENPWFTQSVKQGWRSVEDRLHSSSKGVYGFIGMNSVADEIRMRDAQDDLERDDFMRYAYTSGKKSFYNGREYGIDERGQIFDLEIKKNVTNVLTDTMADAIRKKVAGSSETFKSFSGSGTVIATTGIAADMLLQISLTRGVGNLGRGGAAFLGSFDKGKKVVSGLSSIPMKATTASAMIAQGTLFSTNLASSTYDQAIANGIDQATAIELRQKAGMQGFGLGSLTAPISTQTLAMNKIFGKKGTEKLSRGLVDAYQKGGDKGFAAYIQRVKGTIIQNYPSYLKEGGKEIFQENVQQAGQAFVIAENVNEIAQKEIMNNTITGAEYTNTTILAGLAGLLMPFGGDLKSATSKSIKANFSPGAAAIDRLEALHGLSKDVDKTKEFLNSMVTKGVYTEEQVSNLLSDIDLYVNTINSIPTNLSPETSLVVMQSINKIQKQEELKKQRDKSFHPEIDEKIQELRNEITTRTQFDYVNAQGKLRLKDQAAKELTKEAEERGEKNFTIDDGAITQRAVDNFSIMDVDEKLEYTDLTKQDLKTDKKQDDAIQKPSTEEQVLQDDAGSEKEGGDSQVELRQVGEGDIESDTTQTKEEESETQTDTTSDTTTQTDTEQLVTEETYTLPETEKEREEDFEIIDNRQGKADLEIFEDGEGKWYVENKKTGRTVALRTKAQAKAEVKNPTYDYGEGDVIQVTQETTKSTPSPTVDTSTDKEVMSVNNKIESFANRIIEGGNQESFSDDAIQFYAENREAIDKAVAQKKKNIPKDKSRERTLAIKIARGDTEFSNADIDLYAGSEADVQAEVEAIAKTNSQTVTADTYKAILASTKSTTNKDMAKPETENAQRKRFWKSWNQSAREKKMDLKQKRKSLNDGIKTYAKKRKGKITAAQLRAVLNKVNNPNLNLDNPAAVKEVQQYVEKVFSDADFANDIDIANKLKTRATKKLNSGKLGDNGNLNGAVSQIILAPVTDLTPSQLKSYNEFLQKIAKRDKKTKLDRELIQEANELLNEIASKPETEQELAKIEKQKESDKKVVNKILNPEVSGETIIEENSDFIQNKLDALDSGTLEILVDKVNAAENESNSELVQELNDYAENRQKLINNTTKKSRNVNLNNLSKISLEQSVGPRTLKGLNKGQLAMLTGTELSQLDVYLDNMSEGFYTHFTNNIAQKVAANDRSVNMKPILDKMFTAKGKFSTMRQYAAASVKNGLGKVGFGSSKAARQIGIRGQMIRSNPLSVMDQMFGNYKNNTIYENAIRPTAQAHARFKNWINGQTDTIETIESLIAPSRTEGINQSVKRRFELTTYLLQLEYESNPNKKGTNPAIKFIEDTIDRYNSDKRGSKYNENSIAILKKIAKQYSQNGQISLKKMDDAMSTKTKKALKLLQGIYSGLGELQSYATRIVRGNELDLVNNYVHHKADFKGKERDDANFQNSISFLSLKPGTKSSTSFERAGVTTIDFDPITTALRATRNTGMDYFMSNEISTTRQSMASLKRITKNDDSKTDKQQDQLNQAVLDLNTIYSEALNNVVTNNMSSEVLGGPRLNQMRTLGYYSTLASIPRAGAEYASNLTFAALSAPGEFSLGATVYAGLSMTNKGRVIVENVSSTQNTKLYSDEQLGGSKSDSQGVTKKKSSPKARGKAGQTVEYVLRNTGIKYVPKVVSKIGETLVTKPDQMIARPLWFGTFAKTFKAETGSKVDFDKIADNDSDYMNKYKDAIQKATSKADNNVTMAATSNDPFSSVLKNQVQEGEGGMNFYRMINGYMSRFSLNEYATARQAVASMAGQGQLGVVKGASTLAGVGVRMSMYVMLLRYLNGAMFGMLGIGDEDDTDYEELGIRQGVGAATSLITRGVSGNIPMIPVNYIIESLNKEYGYDVGLRSKEEYNGMEDALVYATINPSNASRNLEEATVMQLTGPFNPYAKAGFRVGKLAIRASTNKTEESRQENLNKLFSSRTGIEVANLFGGVPFYRDIRKGFLEEEFKEGDTTKPFTLEELKFYDLKKYNREMEQKKAPKSRDELDIERELKALEKELEDL